MATPPYRDAASELEAGHSHSVSEKEAFPDGSSPTGLRQYQAPRENMPSARRLLLVLLVSLMAGLGVASAISPAGWARRDQDMAGRDTASSSPEVESFVREVDDAAPETLHALLHKYFPDRFKHGVWRSDAEAVEAVAQPVKRDNSTTSPPSSSSDPTTDPTTSPTPTSGDGTTSGDNPPPTSTGDSGSPSQTDTTPPTSTEPPTHTSNPPSSSSESSETPSKSSSKPTSHLTTNTFTSTKPDGGVVVVTATSYVAGAAETGATTTKPSGSLQTNAAPLRYGRDNILEAIAAGFVVGGALLV